MEKLDETQVLHVGKLARLSIESDVQKYSKQLSAILTDVDKIIDVKLEEEEPIMIFPIQHTNIFSKDEPGEMLEKEQIFKNTENKKGDYLIVPTVIHD